MKVDVADISPVRKKIEVEIPAEKVSEEIGAFLRKLNRQVRVKGFRPGKVPATILKNRYQDYWKDEVSLKLVDDSYQQIVAERGLKPVAYPQVERADLEEGQAFKYSALVDVRPEVEPTDYLGIKLTRRKFQLSPEMIEARLEALRDGQAKVKSLEEDRGLAHNDLAIIDIEGTGEGLSGTWTKKDYSFLLGSASLPDSFSRELVGAKVGDWREFEIVYPADEQNKELAGKRVSFRVMVKEIKEVIRPELDDSLAGALGYQNLEELRKHISSITEKELKDRSDNLLQEDVKKTLLSSNPVELPESMVEEQLRARMGEIKARLRPGSPEPNWDSLAEKMSGPLAEEIKARIILEAIANKEELAVTEADLEEEFAKIAGEANQELNTIRDLYAREEHLENLKRRLLIDKALQFVIEKGEVSELETEL